MSPLVFHFDFISPYAYVAWKGIHAFAERHRRPLVPVPVLFAAILDAHGQKGPAEIPAKRTYTFKDAYRKAHRAGLRLVPPPSHPFNPLLALRVASLPMEAGAHRALIDALYDATWSTGEGVETPERVASIVTRAGFPAADLIERASTQESKDRLRDATRAAIGRGVFGVPTLVADGEIFWGIDGIELADAFLRGEDPVPQDLRLLDRTPSAVRPGAR